MKAESGTPMMREVAGRGLAGFGEEFVCVYMYMFLNSILSAVGNC